MKRFVFQGFFLSLAVVAASAASAAGCGNSNSTTGTGGASSSTTASSTTSTTASSASSTTASSTTGTGGMMTTGTGGAPPACPTCVVVATLPTGSKPYGIVVDATNVYWTNSGTGEVMQAKTDGTAQVKLTTGEDTPQGLQVVGGLVYWSMYSLAGFIRKAPIGGGMITDLASTVGANEIAVGAAGIWWTHDPDDIESVPVGGLPDGGTSNLLTGNPLSNGITSDASSVYWVNRGDGYIKKSDLDLSNDAPLANGDVPWGIVVDATNVYWTEAGSAPKKGKVMAMPKAGGAGVTIAMTQETPQGIAVDATSVYWANRADDVCLANTDCASNVCDPSKKKCMGQGTINKAPLAGGAVTVLAHGQLTPIKLAVDATHVYWTNLDGDTVVKIAK